MLWDISDVSHSTNENNHGLSADNSTSSRIRVGDRSKQERAWLLSAERALRSKPTANFDYTDVGR